MPTGKVNAQAYFFKTSEKSQVRVEDWHEFFNKGIITFERKSNRGSIFEEENYKTNSHIFINILNKVFKNWNK